ncbi:polymorphic toxin type 23 domain-containing protein [Flavobacterium azooxidireducens]|uniref:Polymorphic toxin type 23 domain-containing protein n=1 Tax=Flavobacterium azooxidireducens TaxID=1871076 RepID=A0ABY4KIW6_9FLAO|nr:polymorphic toxin type 23 domain-containing protein [Flavobacterium azooxidireducens]UPQ80325.1 polymorphic toxin type 23 domain-containing protein [Flavobacterium azooxidireducens]
MKKFLLFLVLFFNTIYLFSQEDMFGNTPVQGVIPIKRVGNPITNTTLNRSLTNADITPSTPTGSSPEVGVTEGQLSVSLTGGATYSIPIAVPPGINGIVPQIALSYNSQGGNGLAGYGWNVSGISVITRTPSTRFHDNNIDPVDFDALDRFSFDGQRLIVKNGTSGVYGANSTVYETESFSNVKITSYGVHPSGANYGPAYFIVQYPDGSLAHYGNSVNSRSLTDWAITYWQNPQGVRISYLYTLSNNNLSISKIRYGTRLTTTPINEIDFVYKSRVRAEQAYIGGQNFMRNNILSEIRVKGNNVGFRNYLLTHEATSLGYEILTKITEKSGDNTKSFNPTVFNYDLTTNSDLFNISNPIPLSVGNISFANSSNISGDFDGDGNMDIILYPTIGTDTKKKYWLFSDIQGTGLNIGSEHNVGSFIDIFPTSWLNHSDKLMPMQGWCVIQNNSSNSITSFKNYSAGISNPIYFQYEKTYEFPKFSTIIECPNLPHCDLSPFPENIEPYSMNLNLDRDPITVDPLDPNDPGNTSCPNPININISPILNNEATITWSQLGTPLASSWEIYYFETGLANNPSNFDPIGTYTIVSQNSHVIQNLYPRKSYKFFIRSICGGQVGNMPGTWVGPLNIGGLIEHNPGEVVYQVIPKEYVSGDFNGDGLTDVVAIEKRSSYQAVVCQGNCYTTTNISIPGGKTYFVNLDRRLTENFVNFSGQITTTNNSKFIVADVNGDGKSDLMVFDSGSVKVYSLNENKQFVQIVSQTDGSIKSDKPRYMGDFNGDGKTDFVIPQENNTDSWSFFLATGTGFEKVTTTIGLQYKIANGGYYGVNGFSIYTYSLNEHSYVVNDFNGDGKSDILYQQNLTVEYVMTRNGADYTDYGNPQLTYLVLLENQLSTNNSINFNIVSTNPSFGGIRRNAMPIFLDHNNVNQNLEYGLISGNFIRTFKSTKDNKRDTRLKEIILGTGVKEVITYTPLNSACDLPFNCDYAFEPSTYTENYPNFDIKQANGFQIVSKIEQITPSSQYKKQNFRYYGAVTNVEGLGFLGFRGLLRTNWHNDDNPVISTVTKHIINKRGAINETYTVLGEFYGNFTSYTPTTFINKVNMTYEDELLPNKVYKIKNTFTVSLNGLEGTSGEKSTSYDIYNNPVTTTSVSKNGTTVERTEDINIEYFPPSTGSTYFVGRLKKKNSTVTHNGDTTTGEEIYTYNASHLVSKIQKKGHLTNYLTEDNLYDVFGNITRKTITASGLAPRVTNYTYDTSGRFLISGSDIEGLITTYAYNTSNGLLLSQTLPSNSGFPLITSFLYDVWGKKTRETDYLGKKLNFSYNWLNPSTSGHFSIQTTGDDNSYSSVWLDDLGRKVAQGYKTINDVIGSESNISWKTDEFDIYDRVTKSYESKLSTTPNWSGLFGSTSYDVYGRPIQVVEPTGKTTTIAYSELTTTTSDGVANSTSIKNSLGNVVSMTDNGGTITYQYYANGGLKQSNFEGVIVAVEQDGWGRKTKLTDPSAGIYEYEYNEFGEITKETTPKGITTYTLDNFGKVSEKTIVGTGGDTTNNKTTYTYNSASKLLTNSRYDDFTGGFYTTYSYGYDNYKRLNFYDESGFNAYYQRATQFDAFGRPEKELYTGINTSDGKRSDKWIKNTYKNGHHWQIVDDATNQVLWQTTKVNARGQLINGNYGNGINITNTYDQHGYPSQFKHDKLTIPTANVMTLNSVFEPERGNLTSRYNSMFDHQENFTYDGLDRLTSWSNNNEIQNFTFTNTIDGFIPTNTNVSIVNETNSSYSRLKVTTNVNFEGTQKTVKSHAFIGEVLAINGQIFLKNLVGVNNYAKFSVVERNPNTGQTIEIQYGINAGINFSFQHTVSQYSEIAIKIIAGNDINFQAPISFSLDNIKVVEIKTESQTYDTLGRIDENNIGSYNYTNTSKPFQNTSVETNTSYSDYYLSRANLAITYNTFKSPVDIIEEGKDKLSFIYNMNNSRSTMYYGSLEADKLARRYRKHYAADGSMEIKQDIVNGTVEFITYIGGDAYSAPIMLKSDGTMQNYLYLHRDYLGSIVAVTNQSGAVVEKRLFDAWGNIKKVEDGSGNVLTGLLVLDRGYTGHEHLQGVNLIHMNGRLYDPVVHRFLQPDNFVQDPYNTQNYNRYSYVYNNPLKYTDKNGEWIWAAVWVGAIIGAAAGGASYIAHAIQTGNWSWGGFGMSVLSGAIIGGISGGYASATTAVTASAVGNTAASSFAAAFFPAISVPIGDWSISVSPSIAFGNASGAGISLGVGYSDGDWSFSGGVGVMSYSNYNGFGANANEVRYSALVNYDDGKTGFSLGTNFWRGSAGSDGNNLNQRTGMVGFHNGDFRVMYENDGSIGPLGDGGDSYRSAALNLSVGDFTAGFNLMTGKRNYKGEESLEGGHRGKPEIDKFNRRMPNGYALEEGNKYRLGALTVGYKGYRVGVNSEHVRHAIQDQAIHNLKLGPLDKRQRGFENQSWDWKGYFQYKTPNQFTSW